MYSENDYRYYLNNQNELSHYGVKGMKWNEHKAKRVERINKAFREAKAADDSYRKAVEMRNRVASSERNKRDNKGHNEHAMDQRNAARAKQQKVFANRQLLYAKRRKDFADKQLLYAQQPFRKTMDDLSDKIKKVKNKLKDFFKVETKRNITSTVLSGNQRKDAKALAEKQLRYSKQPMTKVMDDLKDAINDVKKKFKDFFKVDTKRTMTSTIFTGSRGKDVKDKFKSYYKK